MTSTMLIHISALQIQFYADVFIDVHVFIEFWMRESFRNWVVVFTSSKDSKEVVRSGQKVHRYKITSVNSNGYDK